MIDLHVTKETAINASPEAVFAVVSDLIRHEGRGADVTRGMEKTLENLRKAAEK